MLLYRTKKGILLELKGEFVLIENQNWDEFINDDSLFLKCLNEFDSNKKITNSKELLEKDLLKPIVGQEIWASGVTYFNSKLARQEESKDAGGADFYAKVYTAERPELFFKSNGERAVGHNEKVAIRKDSSWNVPEPELTLFISKTGIILGYTIGNDMSSRSIEGENPLYLPQAKSYDRSAAIGPAIYVSNDKLDPNSEIRISIFRKGEEVFSGAVSISQIKRSFEELVAYLFLELSFPNGCFLMTGTGIIPESDFTLHIGDRISIEIDSIGKLVNEVG